METGKKTGFGNETSFLTLPIEPKHKEQLASYI